MTRVVVVTKDSIQAGREAFCHYQDYLACGSASRNYEQAVCRPTGPEMIAGAAYACIQRGLSLHEEVIAAVSKATRCRSATVHWILNELTGEGTDGYPFAFDGESYYLNGLKPAHIRV